MSRENTVWKSGGGSALVLSGAKKSLRVSGRSWTFCVSKSRQLRPVACVDERALPHPRCASARPRRDREISLDAQTIAKSDKHHDAHPRLAEMRIRPATSVASTRSVCSSTSVLLAVRQLALHCLPPHGERCNDSPYSGRKLVAVLT